MVVVTVQGAPIDHGLALRLLGWCHVTKHDWLLTMIGTLTSCRSEWRGVRGARRTGSTQRSRGGRHVGFGHMVGAFFNSIAIESHQASMSCVGVQRNRRFRS
jgi:hypothetical protein